MRFDTRALTMVGLLTTLGWLAAVVVFDGRVAHPAPLPVAKLRDPDWKG